MENSKILFLNGSVEEFSKIQAPNHVFVGHDFDPTYDYKKDEFNLIIINLKSENDLNIIKYFRNNHDFDFIPVVCLVDENLGVLSLELRKLGCDGSFIIPVDVEEFIIKIHSILKRYKEICKSSVSALLPSLMNNNADLKLTNREKDLLQLVAKGFTNMEISKSLYLSEMTVKTHLKNIFKKLNVSNRTEAVLIGIINNLIEI